MIKMANINIGDKVKFLNEVGGGVVTEIVDKYLVKVMTEDEWEMPALKSELIVVEPITGQDKIEVSEEKKNDKTLLQKTGIEEEVSINISNDITLILAILSLDNNSQKVINEVYLINDSDYFVFYNISTKANKDLLPIATDVLEPNTKIQIGRYTNEELIEISDMLTQFIFFRKEKHKYVKPVEMRINLQWSDKKLFEKSDFFEEKAVLFSLYQQKEEESLSREEIIELMSKSEKAKQRVDNNFQIDFSKERVIIDLHIEELLQNYDKLEPAEILKIQMDEFHKGMKKIITKGIKEAVFIHGKGKGVLKRQIYSELKSNYKGFAFQDASFMEYGYAATLVVSS